MSLKPVVSVIIPTYNRGAAIAPTIESVLSQTLPSEHYEIIIIDDGSTDDTLQFLHNEYSKYANVRIFSQLNAGVANARNKGLQGARGEFVAFLDHDDLWLPQKLEKQVEVLRAKFDVGVVYCGWQDIKNEDDLSSPRIAQNALRKMPTGEVYPQLLRWNFIVSMSVPLVRANLIREIGGFDANVAPNDDWDLWLRLARKTSFACVPEVLVLYRRHSKQQSQTSEKMFTTTTQVLKKQLPQTRGKPLLRSRIYASCAFADSRVWYVEAKTALFSRQWRRAYRIFFAAAIHHPWCLVAPEWLYFFKRLIARNSQNY